MLICKVKNTDFKYSEGTFGGSRILDQGLPSASVNNIIPIRFDESDRAEESMDSESVRSTTYLDQEIQAMANEDLSLMAHLMRRAGFGATREELEEATGERL